MLSAWSVFLVSGDATADKKSSAYFPQSPMTGILISDYFFVRKQKLRIDDLYVGNEDSAYWYFKGFNWRAFTAWVMGLWPLLRKYFLTGKTLDANITLVTTDFFL